MTEKPTDWRVKVTLDREALAEDIDKLVRILARQRVAVIVSASSREEALEKGREHLQRHNGISGIYIKDLQPRRLPT